MDQMVLTVLTVLMVKMVLMVMMDRPLSSVFAKILTVYTIGLLTVNG